MQDLIPPHSPKPSNHRIFLFLIVVSFFLNLVVSIILYNRTNSISQENTERLNELERQIEEEVKTTCIDSDVNEKSNDIYTKGTITLTDKDGEETVRYDECTGSKTQVNEMWCYESPKESGNYVGGRMVHDCPLGCLDGACVQ